jgi:hypothetical protein
LLGDGDNNKIKVEMMALHHDDDFHDENVQYGAGP